MSNICSCTHVTSVLHQSRSRAVQKIYGSVLHESTFSVANISERSAYPPFGRNVRGEETLKKNSNGRRLLSL